MGVKTIWGVEEDIACGEATLAAISCGVLTLSALDWRNARWSDTQAGFLQRNLNGAKVIRDGQRFGKTLPSSASKFLGAQSRGMAGTSGFHNHLVSSIVRGQNHAIQ
jgi:hypothetical protein